MYSVHPGSLFCLFEIVSIGNDSNKEEKAHKHTPHKTPKVPADGSPASLPAPLGLEGNQIHPSNFFCANRCVGARRVQEVLKSQVCWHSVHPIRRRRRLRTRHPTGYSRHPTAPRATSQRRRLRTRFQPTHIIHPPTFHTHPLDAADV